MRKMKLVSDMGYKPASEIKSLSYTMLHRSIVTHAQARRIAAAH